MSSKDEKTTPSYVQQWQHCIDHARDLIESGRRVLSNDNAFPNIAYHLAILALEEIGKAGMLCARGIVGQSLDSKWIDQRLDDHVWKMLWAVWSPSISGAELSPETFEESRRFAESSHKRRMAGLYVDFDPAAVAPPKQFVSLEHALSIMKLASARLALEEAKGPNVRDESNDDLAWYLTTVNDEHGQKRLFSPTFLSKHHEFGGNSREWVRWARDEFNRIAQKEEEALKAELARQVSEPKSGKPKWLMKIRVKTPSHSLRQNELNYWNDRITWVQLRAAGAKSQDLLLELTVFDHVKLDELFEFGLLASKMHLIMLNIATAGFFWYDLSSQAEKYFESVQDLDNPDMQVVMRHRAGLVEETTDALPGNHNRKRVVLDERLLNNALRALGVFGSMPDNEAAPIFGPYLNGMVLLSKSDLHLTTETQARDAFVLALRRAMHKFGDLKAESDDLLSALHAVTAPIIQEEAHRTMVFGEIETRDRVSVGHALAAKRAADLYLSIVAGRLWPEFVKRRL